MVFFKGLCIANHNNDIPGFHFTNFGITSALTRSWYHDTCPNKGKPCFVYTTLPEDALGSVFISFHINPHSCKGDWAPKLEYSEVDAVSDIPSITTWNTWSEQEKGEYRPPSHEHFSREVYTCLLKGLQESKIYAFRVSQEGWSETPDVYYHQNFNTKKMKILNGGDIGNVKPAKRLHENVVRGYDADMILVGGDISYDNNFATCFYWYDHLFKRLPYLKIDESTNATRVIPLILAVGNHDLGVNNYSGRNLTEDENDSMPVYKHFFPQNTHQGGIPKRKDRRTYFTKKFGDSVLLLVLDTGYEVEMAEQEQFIKDELSKDYTYKFAIYHHPLYSAWSKGEKDKATSQGRKIWVPLFDEHKLTMSFENHVHGFKRTKPLKDGKVAEGGTIYIGDGSWGPLVGHWGVNNRDLMENYGRIHHVWQIEFDENQQLKANAYNDKGENIDSFVTTIRKNDK